MPISIALELLGDPWSLLIVRDLMFKGLNTFSGFQQAGEGIATNVLSDRLARLARGGDRDAAAAGGGPAARQLSADGEGHGSRAGAVSLCCGRRGTSAPTRRRRW